MVAFRAASQATGGGSGLSVIVPAAAQSGDLAVLFIDLMNNTASVQVPAGWVQRGVARGTANITTYVYYKLLTSSDANSTVTVTNDNGAIRVALSMVVYSGVRQSVPIQASAQATSNVSSAQYTTPTVTATAAGYLVEHVAERGNPVGTNWTTTSPMIERLDIRSSLADAVNVSAVTADRLVTGAGSYGGSTWTSTTATSHNSGWSIIINEAPDSSATLIQEDFEGGADGADLTDSNSVFSSTDYSAASIKFSSDIAAKNSKSAFISIGETSGRASARIDYTSSPAAVALRWYQYVTAVSENTMLGTVRSSDNTMIAQVRLNSDRTLQMYSGQTSTATSIAAVPLNTWIRIEWQVNTNGTQALQVFSGSNLQATAPANALVSLNGSIPTGLTIDRSNVGVTTSTTNYSAYYDAYRVNVGTVAVGPDPAVGVAGSGGLIQGVRVSGVTRPVVRMGVRVGGVWRPVVSSAIGVGGVWRPGAAPTPAPDPDPDPEPPVAAKMPLYVSPSGSNKILEYENREDAGWGSGFFAYWGGDMQWNSGWTAFVARHPEGVPVLASPKGVGSAATNTFMQNLPPAWREKFIICYYQEPEDNHETDALRADYRAKVKTLAGLVRPYGVRNGVHLQEWALNPMYDQHQHTYKFVQNADDIDFGSWSMYGPHNTTMQGWRDRVDRIAAFMAQYLPGKPWGVTAAGIPVYAEDPIGGSSRLDRAQKVRTIAEYIIAKGGLTFGWFDHDGYNPGRDQLASKDPDLTNALRYVSDLNVPGGLPWS